MEHDHDYFKIPRIGGWGGNAPSPVMRKSDSFNEAYKNVAFGADGTWGYSYNAHKKTSMDLYVRERLIRRYTTQFEHLTPRTVRDCIPASKLAKYSNYEYDESRELSYSPCLMRYQRLYETFKHDFVQEPWMLEEIDQLLLGFLFFKDPVLSNVCVEDYRENLGSKVAKRCEVEYVSPFMEASKFEEMALKLKIAGVRDIWEEKPATVNENRSATSEKTVMVHKSPTGNYFIENDDTSEMSNDWLLSENESFAHLQSLSKSFREQISWMPRSGNFPYNTWLDPREDSNDFSTNRRLYSAVLQGTSSKILTQKHPSDTHSDLNKEIPAMSNASGSNAYPTSRPPMYTNFSPISGAYMKPASFLSNYQFHSPAIVNNPYYLIKNNPYVQPCRYGYGQRSLQAPTLVMQNAGKHSYYSPMAFQQRPLHHAMCPRPTIQHRPLHVVPQTAAMASSSSSNWCTLHHLNRIPPQKRMEQWKTGVHNREENPFDDVVESVVRTTMEDGNVCIPVSLSSSEDLELQALEQYSGSKENVFLELERQAAEQYESNSENWKSPPNPDVLFGGLVVVVMVVWLRRVDVGIRIGIRLSSLRITFCVVRAHCLGKKCYC